MADLPADLSAGSRSRLPAGPIGTACGLAVASTYVAAVDPSDRGAFPTCPFRAVTGLWCPGCGMTRATHHLLHGDVLGALRFNALLPIVLALIIVAWVDWYARSTGRPALLRHVPRWAPLVGIVFAVATPA